MLLNDCPLAAYRRSTPVRPVTSMRPSGRKARLQGLGRPVASSVTTTGLVVGTKSGSLDSGGLPEPSPSPPPQEVSRPMDRARAASKENERVVARIRPC